MTNPDPDIDTGRGLEVGAAIAIIGVALVVFALATTIGVSATIILLIGVAAILGGLYGNWSDVV